MKQPEYSSTNQKPDAAAEARLLRLPTQTRCPACIGQGTNSRGSLCTLCHGLGEIPVPPAAEGTAAKELGARERPRRI